MGLPRGPGAVLAMVDLLRSGGSYFVGAELCGDAFNPAPLQPQAFVPKPTENRIFQLTDPAQVPSDRQDRSGSLLAGRLISAQPAHDVGCALELFRQGDRILDRLTGALAKIQRHRMGCIA